MVTFTIQKAGLHLGPSASGACGHLGPIENTEREGRSWHERAERTAAGFEQARGAGIEGPLQPFRIRLVSATTPGLILTGSVRFAQCSLGEAEQSGRGEQRGTNALRKHG